LFLISDELGNLTRFIDYSYWQNVSFLPQWIYNDRPVGFVLAQGLFDAFGFNYRYQVGVFLVLHAANCGMGYLLSRRLGVSIPLSIAAIGAFGGLWSTAQTVTYIGAVFDVTCLFFLLGSTLALLWDQRGSSILSALLFLLALRSKEFAIVLPVLLFILGLQLWQPGAILRRLWLHIAIAVVFGIRYLSFLPRAIQVVGPQDPYHADPSIKTVLYSLSYYTRLIFGAESAIGISTVVVFTCLAGAIVAYGLYRHNFLLLYGLASYFFLLLPVAILPGIRSAYYVYAPQLFLLLSFVILVEDLNAGLFKTPAVRWAASLGIGTLLLAWTIYSQGSAAFKNGTAFLVTIRTASSVTAESAKVLIPSLQSTPHLYLNHGQERPWLFTAGPCAYFKLITRNSATTCSLHSSKDAAQAAYDRDDGGKMLLEYAPDGSLRPIRVSPIRR